MPLIGMVVGLGPGDFVLDGDPGPSPKGGGAPSQFSAQFYCGRTAECIKRPLGIEVGLGQEDFVLEPISVVSGPKFTILSGHVEEVLLPDKFFSDCRYMP